MLEPHAAASPQEVLRAHRHRIEEADTLLLEAIALRLREVARLQAWKRRQGMAAEDPAQEREVLERARLWAGDHGLPPDVAERVLVLLIQEGKARSAPRVPTPGRQGARSSAMS